MGLLVFLCGLTFAAASARAQSDGTFSTEPRCVTLVNKTGAEVLGHVETALYTDATGRNHWYRKNFKLDDQKTEEACSTGPFFPGGQIRVVVKTLFPLYTCLVTPPKTVTITRQKIGYGITEVVMDCPAEQGGGIK